MEKTSMVTGNSNNLFMQIKLECNNISSLPDLLREIASQIELT